MGIVLLSVICLSLIWTCKADNYADYRSPAENLHHQVISNNCSFDSIFQNEDLCASSKIYSVCLAPNTGKIRKCFFLNFEAPFNSSVMPEVLEEYGINCSNVSYPMNGAIDLLVLCSDFRNDVCPGEDMTILMPCASRTKRQQPGVPKLDADAYYASCENCTIALAMIVDEEENEMPVIELRSEPLKEPLGIGRRRGSERLRSHRLESVSTESSAIEDASPPESTTARGKPGRKWH